jgi:hypothetical protein
MGRRLMTDYCLQITASTQSLPCVTGAGADGRARPGDLRGNTARPEWKRLTPAVLLRNIENQDYVSETTMTSRLTLSAKKEVIAKAKKLAAARGTSVSAMFSQLVLALDAPHRPADRPGPISRKLFGIVKFPKGKSDRELLTEALMEKYCGRR